VKLSVHMTIIALAASYLTLGVVAVDEAEQWWWAYTVTTLLLAAVGYYLERKGPAHDHA
jgi:predicted membrane channel-forming protein YqfA (hemolysin III family)